MCGSGDLARPIFGRRRTTIKQPMNLPIDISSHLRGRPKKSNHSLTMKMIIAFAALVAVALAAPQGNPQDIVITKEVPSDNLGIDGYNFSYEQSDGQSRQESAQLKNAGTENAALAVTGSFSFYDPTTNRQYTINYVADENGFRPQGEHIPSV